MCTRVANVTLEGFVDLDVGREVAVRNETLDVRAVALGDGNSRRGDRALVDVLQIDGIDQTDASAQKIDRAAERGVVDGRNDRARRELGDFLRRRRARLTTDGSGLPATRRRRTPGLRREEVAELANISTALYAWLEQGRDVPVSRRTIDAIADALQLTPGEREHISALTNQTPTPLHEDLSPTLRRAVTSFTTHPVFILDHKWDIALANRAAQVCFHCDSAIPAQVNLLEALFDDGCKALFVNWADVAVSVVELFRYDYPLYAAEPAALAIVERLRAADAVFAEIWNEHRVRRSTGVVRQLNHPIAGLLSVEPSVFAVVESPGLRMMMFTPTDDATARQIGELVADSGSPV